MEMQQLETMAEVFRLQHLRRLQQFGRAQAELGVFAAAAGPAARAPAHQPRADAEQRFDIELFGNRNDMPQLLQFLDDQDDHFTQLDAEHRHLDELRVLVTIANNQTADLILQRQAGQQFWFAADFEAEIKRLARVENFLHDLAELVHLDREHAAVTAPVTVFRDGIAEGLVQRFDPVAQDVLKPDEQRKLQPARLGFLDHVGQIHRHAGVLQRSRHDVSLVVDVKILRAPAMNVIQVARRFNVPRPRRPG